MLMIDEAGRKKKARLYKAKQHNTPKAVTSSKKRNCLGWDSNPRYSTLVHVHCTVHNIHLHDTTHAQQARRAGTHLSLLLLGLPESLVVALHTVVTHNSTQPNKLTLQSMQCGLRAAPSLQTLVEDRICLLNCGGEIRRGYNYKCGERRVQLQMWRKEGTITRNVERGGYNYKCGERRVQI